MKPYKSIVSAILTASVLMTPQALPYLAQTDTQPPSSIKQSNEVSTKTLAPFSDSRDLRFTLQEMPLDMRALISIHTQTLSSIKEQSNRSNNTVTTLTRLNEKQWDEKEIPQFHFEMDEKTRKRLPAGFGKGKTTHETYWVISARQLRKMKSEKAELLINGQWVKCQSYTAENIIRDTQTGQLRTEDRMMIWVAEKPEIQSPAVVIDRHLLPPNTVAYQRTRQIYYDGYEPRFREVKAQLISADTSIKLNLEDVKAVEYEVVTRTDKRSHSDLQNKKSQGSEDWNVTRSELWYHPSYTETPLLSKQSQHQSWVDPSTDTLHHNISHTTTQLSFELQLKDHPKHWKHLSYSALDKFLPNAKD